MITTLIVSLILFSGSCIFFANTISAIHYTYENNKRLIMNRFILVITGIITFISIMLFGIFLMINYQERLNSDKNIVKPEYEIIHEPVYRKIN